MLLIKFFFLLCFPFFPTSQNITAWEEKIPLLEALWIKNKQKDRLCAVSLKNILKTFIILNSIAVCLIKPWVP